MQDASPAGTTLLITGFGPFPGVDHNISSDLAHAIALQFMRQNARIRPTVSADALTLPTAWGTANRGLHRAITRQRPDAILALGVSRRATGFTVETRARNIAKAPDITGIEPQLNHLSATERRHRSGRFPARALVRHLRRKGLPAVRSHNAGAYLCNALLFDLLTRKSATPDSPALFVFIHVPATLVDPEPGGLSHRLDWQSALDGGLTIANFMVDWHEQYQRPAFHAAPFIGG